MSAHRRTPAEDEPRDANTAHATANNVYGVWLQGFVHVIPNVSRSDTYKAGGVVVGHAAEAVQRDLNTRR